MDDECLDVEFVKVLRKDQGRSITWLNEKIGMPRSPGYLMFKKGYLPGDRRKRKTVLEKLAKILGVEVRQILLRLEAKRIA